MAVTDQRVRHRFLAPSGHSQQSQTVCFPSVGVALEVTHMGEWGGRKPQHSTALGYVRCEGWQERCEIVLSNVSC